MQHRRHRKLIHWTSFLLCSFIWTSSWAQYSELGLRLSVIRLWNNDDVNTNALDGTTFDSWSRQNKSRGVIANLLYSKVQKNGKFWRFRLGYELDYNNEIVDSEPTSNANKFVRDIEERITGFHAGIGLGVVGEIDRFSIHAGVELPFSYLFSWEYTQITTYYDGAGDVEKVESAEIDPFGEVWTGLGLFASLDFKLSDKFVVFFENNARLQANIIQGDRIRTTIEQDGNGNEIAVHTSISDRSMVFFRSMFLNPSIGLYLRW